ncbi:MAG: MerR family transcriptional regulator, partial [Rubrobacter sp.]|nr:MerR family transcriptional regulator [Rubrobacter sp.]
MLQGLGCDQLLGVSVGWLRIGERLGALPAARRNEVGWRCYTRQDIERLRRLGVGERKRRLKRKSMKLTHPAMLAPSSVRREAARQPAPWPQSQKPVGVQCH